MRWRTRGYAALESENSRQDFGLRRSNTARSHEWAFLRRARDILPQSHIINTVVAGLNARREVVVGVMKSGYSRGVAMTVCMAALWGGVSPLSKYIGSHGVSMVSVMCYRAVVVAAVTGLWLRFSLGSGWYRVSRQLLLTYLLLGLLTTALNACGFMISCFYLTVPQALMIHYTYPLVTMAGSYFVTGEKPTAVQAAAGVMVLAGLYVGFTGDGGVMASVSAAGVVWAVLSVIGLSGQTLVSRRILMGGGTNPIVQLFYVHLFGGVIIAACKSLSVGWGDLAAVNGVIFALTQYSACCAGLIGFGLMFSALRLIPASLVSLICTLELVFALVITALLLGQYPTPHELAGCAVVMASVACAALSGRKS